MMEKVIKAGRGDIFPRASTVYGDWFSGIFVARTTLD
jgi:hypothetical protein